MTKQINSMVRERIINCDTHFDNDQIEAVMQILDDSGYSDMYEALIEADRIICELCKRLNPQHITTDSHLHDRGCEWCQDRENRLKALAKAEGGKS